MDIATQEVDELIPPFVMRQLWYATKGNCTVVTDVGQHQMWEAQYFTHLRPGHLITSGGLGTMGFGVPAAMGAKLGKPDELVWAIVGDGGFQQTMQELATIDAGQRRQSRSASSTTASWAWCASGSSSSTTRTTPARPCGAPTT